MLAIAHAEQQRVAVIDGADIQDIMQFQADRLWRRRPSRDERQNECQDCENCTVSLAVFRSYISLPA